MYGGRNGKLIYLANDDSIYCNHSKDGYNIDFADDLGETEIAIRDIQAGEEIFDNYLMYNRILWAEELCSKYNCYDEYMWEFIEEEKLKNA